MTPPDPRVVDLVATFTPGDLVVHTPDAAVAEALAARGTATTIAVLDAITPGTVPMIALIGDELSRAGDHAESLLADAVTALRAGGLLVVAARNRIHAAVHGTPLDGLRAWSAEELVRTVGHPGIAVEHVVAPGAAAALRGSPGGPAERELDRSPGLIDAAPQTLVLGRRPGDPIKRSEAFFASIPRKLVAAATVVRDPDGRLLCVHDTFRQHWTIPGGVVDADEDPETGAVRETWEEAGLRVRAENLLGVFAMPWPDRVLFLYGATPVNPVDLDLVPVHAHEIDDAVWLPLDEALATLNRRTAAQVRRCLDTPGRTWADAG